MLHKLALNLMGFPSDTVNNFSHKVLYPKSASPVLISSKLNYILLLFPDITVAKIHRLPVVNHIQNSG